MSNFNFGSPGRRGALSHTHSMTSSGQVHPLFSGVLILSLYLAGLTHWAWFYRYGAMNLSDGDWQKEHDYYTLLDTWITEGGHPYHMSKRWQDTDRFLGLPETLFSPQILLLRRLDIGTFQPVNTGLMYSLGFLGCLLIRRRYRLGLIPFTLLALLFSCNGHITAHLSVGHSMWNGYFLLSFFVLYVLEIVEQPAAHASGLKLAMVLLLMMLQGSFHLVMLCWIFLGLLCLSDRRCWRTVAMAVGFSVWLSFFRTLPAAVTFAGGFGLFLSGYPDATELVHALVSLRSREYPPIVNPFNNLPLYWWEFDAYIGLLGLGLLLYGGIYLRMRAAAPPECRYRALDLPMLVTCFLSLNYVYWLVVASRLPLMNAERVSSRFLIVPLVLLISLAAICLQRELERLPRTPLLYLFLVLALVQTACDLATHSNLWRVLPAEADTTYLSDARFVEREDPSYIMSVHVSALVSLAAIPAWIWAMVRVRRTPKAGA